MTCWDVFLTALAFLDDHQLAWQHATVEKTEGAIHWMMVNAARVALNSTRTHANRVKFPRGSGELAHGL